MVADDVLRQGDEGISTIITSKGDVNTDFADVRNAMRGQGKAILGIGVGEGENRAVEAATKAISNPMIEDSHINGAKNILINICASEKVSMSEVTEICTVVTAQASHDYNMFWGQVTSPQMGDKISVTIIATGFDAEDEAVVEKEEAKPVVEEAPIDDENVMRATEFASLIHSKKPSNTNSLRPQQNAQKSDNMFGYESVPTVKGLEKDSHEKEKWGPSLFNFDDDSAFSVQPKRKTITPPDGYIFQDDINQPAIWQKERYGKGINLSDN